ERMRAEAIAMLTDLRAPGETSLTRVDANANNAVARALLVADRRCAEHAVKTARLLVYVSLSPHGGTPRSVVVAPDSNQPLATCVRRTLLETRYPAVGNDVQVNTALVLAGAQRRFDETPGPSDPIETGAMIGAAARLSGLATTGFEIDTVFDITRLSSFRLI